MVGVDAQQPSPLPKFLAGQRKESGVGPELIA
jgi:hypothetical protein